jgi:hypothetical protein
MDKDFLTIETKTTGFGSPARAYTGKRLDPNDILIQDPYTTFFFQWEGETKLGLSFGDFLVVDRGVLPQPEDLVVCEKDGRLSCEIYSEINPEDLWGTITWKLCQLKK